MVHGVQQWWKSLLLLLFCTHDPRCFSSISNVHAKSQEKIQSYFSVERWGLAICRALNCQIKCRNSWGQLYQVDLSIDLFDALHSGRHPHPHPCFWGLFTMQLFVGFSKWMGFSSNFLHHNSCYAFVWLDLEISMSKWSNIGYTWWTHPTKVESIDEIAIKYPQKVHKHRKESTSLEGTHLALPESGDEKLLGEGSHLPKPQGFSRGGWPAIVCKCADLWKLNMQPWKGHVHNHVNAFRGRRRWDQDTHPKVD